MKFTVVVTTYRRYTRLDKILQAWFLAGADEVILANGGKWFNTKIPVRQFLFNPDPGNKIRFASAYLARNEFIVLADDDVLPKPGIFEDYHKCFNKNRGLYGIIGRRDHGNAESYWECSFIRADKLAYPVKVFFVGVIYFTTYNMLPRDLIQIKDRAVDDLHWCMVEQWDVPKFVFPTKNYENMKPECNDDACIFHTPESKKYRNKFFMMHRRRENDRRL